MLRVIRSAPYKLVLVLQSLGPGLVLIVAEVEVGEASRNVLVDERLQKLLDFV